MGIRKWLLIIFLMSSFMIFPTTVSSQPEMPPPPADIVFMTAIEEAWEVNGGPFVLALLDADTMTLIELYRSTEVALKPLSWSPQGDLLAVVRANDTNEPGKAELCIITMSGSFHTCFEDKLASFDSLEGNTVTWSEDGTRVRFVTLKEPTWQLVEASVATGETLRVIYETDFSERERWRRRPTVWTADLTYVGLEVGSPSPGILINLETHEELDLHDVLQPYIDQAVEQEHHEYYHVYVCPDFSPANAYLVGLIPLAYTGTQDSANRMVIFDTQGNVEHVFEPPDSIASCPTWWDEDRGFYFRRYNPVEVWGGIFWYDLANSRLHAYDMSGRETLPLVPSPDRTYLAFEERTDRRTVISILYPVGVIRTIDMPYHSAWFPVWRPTGE